MQNEGFRIGSYEALRFEAPKTGSCFKWELFATTTSPIVFISVLIAS